MSESNRVLERFEPISDARMRELLAPPNGPVRLIIDTDTANEIDDQFALTWALLSSDRLEIEGVTAEPFTFQHMQAEMLEAHRILERGAPETDREAALVKAYGGWLAGYAAKGQRPEDIVFTSPAEGQELSHTEILTVFDKLNRDPNGLVFPGASGYLTSLDTPIRTPAVEHIVERALTEPDRPLYIAAIGCVTNIASALLIAPEIAKNIVVLWTSSYPSHAPHSNEPSLNLVQDVLASQLLFDCGVPHVYLPGYHVGAQLRISLPEMERFVKGKGAIGDYLFHLYTHNPIHEQRGVGDASKQTWVIWDIINIAWLLNPDWVPSMLVPSPRLGDDLFWHHPDGRHLMREAYDIDRDAVFADFYEKLNRAP